MRNKKDRPAAATEPIHGVEAFALKARVADSQNLINDEDIRIEMGGYGKAQAQAHAGRVALDRCIQELCHAGKFHHGVQLGGDLAVFHAQYGAVQVDVLPAGEFLVKTGAHFEKRSDAARHVDFTGSGIGDFGQHFEKRALSGAIAPDDAHDLTGIDTKRDIAQGPKDIGGSRAPAKRCAQHADQPFTQHRVALKRAQNKLFGDFFNRDGLAHILIETRRQCSPLNLDDVRKRSLRPAEVRGTNNQKNRRNNDGCAH